MMELAFSFNLTITDILKHGTVSKECILNSLFSLFVF